MIDKGLFYYDINSTDDRPYHVYTHPLDAHNTQKKRSHLAVCL